MNECINKPVLHVAAHKFYKRKHRDVSHDLFEAIRQRFHSVLLHRITLRSELQKDKQRELKRRQRRRITGVYACLILIHGRHCCMFK